MTSGKPAKTSKDKYNFHRQIDKWVGSMLLFLLGCVFFVKRRRPAEVRSVALMKFDGIGDVVLVTAIAKDLREAFPGAKIILMCGPFNLPLASLLTTFDHIVLLNIANPFATVMELRRWAPDICVDLGEWSRLEALLAFFSRAKWTIGFKTRGQHRHYAYDMWRPLRFDQHELDNYRSLLQAMGVKTSHRPVLELAEAARVDLDGPRWAGPYALLHLWSGSATWSHLKEWPQDRWREIAEWLNAKGFAVYLTGGKSDAPRADAFIEDCKWPSARVENICGMGFPELIAALRQARVVVSIDTSITHMAAAAGTRVLSLHGPSSSKRWGPIGPRAHAIDSTCPGCGYMNWGADSDKERAKLPCMDTITVADVKAKVEKMLSGDANS